MSCSVECLHINSGFRKRKPIKASSFEKTIQYWRQQFTIFAVYTILDFDFTKSIHLKCKKFESFCINKRPPVWGRNEFT